MPKALPICLAVTLAAATAWAQLPAGAEFQVNSYTTSLQAFPAVASAANGNFVAVWTSSGQDGSGYGVFGQRFNASGVRQGSEFRANASTASTQIEAAVGSDASGNFVVVWSTGLQDGSGYGVFGRRFSAAGLPLGSDFQVNSYTTSSQRYPAVASDANGNFVVVWHSDGPDGSSLGVFGQRFNASGVPQASEFQINSYTPNPQRFPAVASAANGNFVVVWEDFSSHDGVFGQRFNASGVRQGSEFQANATAFSDQNRAAVGSDANGNFVVVWQSFGQDGSGYGVFGQRFNAGGLPQGPEFRVNSFTTSFQFQPAVASAANGNFVVVWDSFGQDGSGYGVFGQRFGDLIFADGFDPTPP